MSKLVMVEFWVESDCDPVEEVVITFLPIDPITFDDAADLQAAAEEYPREHALEIERIYRIVFEQHVHHDGAGAITDIWWEPIASAPISIRDTR